jgi:hypothetical protein
MGWNTEKATETEGGLFSKLRWFSGDKKRNDNNDRTEDGMIIEAEEMVRMKGGFERLYTEASNCVSLLDRVNTDRLGFHVLVFDSVRIGLKQQILTNIVLLTLLETLPS